MIIEDATLKHVCNLANYYILLTGVGAGLITLTMWRNTRVSFVLLRSIRWYSGRFLGNHALFMSSLLVLLAAVSSAPLYICISVLLIPGLAIWWSIFAWVTLLRCLWPCCLDWGTLLFAPVNTPTTSSYITSKVEPLGVSHSMRTTCTNDGIFHRARQAYHIVPVH